MKIYGVAIVSGCYITGILLGEMLGDLFNIDGNLGGVGFAMLFLVILTDWLKKKELFHAEYEYGIGFWSSMYIPIVIAMSTIQNVKGALSSGFVALAAGIVSTAFCFMLVPFLIKAIHQNNK
jgi:malonate transporter MadL subunit